ncbi:MAG TPA: endonuclease/exonuclease/phosphatase family protein [Kribbellaceae bacterium]|nr:endonuclease/exonuclease/phosphatase family protein [Kribbellaceae bacterium]
MTFRTIRVVTWNLWWRFGPWEKRAYAISAVLRRVQPDVCGLQEVWADRERSLAALLAAELGMHLAWTPSPFPDNWQKKVGDFNTAVGNAIISRWPILEHDMELLPAGAAPSDGRTAVFALLDMPSGRVPFFTTHLNSARDHSSIRCEQVRALARFVAQRPSGEFPFVITGDFNAEPDSDEMRLLLGPWPRSSSIGLRVFDAWDSIVSSVDGPTWDRSNPFVAETGEPSARIDYVLVGPPLPSGAGRVQSARLAGTQAVRGVFPSDHAAVVVDLCS